jgi:transposase
MSQPFDASRSLTSLEQDSTIIAVIEMSQAKWLVAAVIPGVERQPLKKIDADEAALLNSCIVGATNPARLGAR